MFYQAAIVRASQDAKKQWVGVQENLLPEAHVFLIGDSPQWDASCEKARKEGLVVEGVLMAVFPKKTIPCLLLRKGPSDFKGSLNPLLFHDPLCTELECEAGCQVLMHRDVITPDGHKYTSEEDLEMHLEALLLPLGGRLLTWYPHAPH